MTKFKKSLAALMAVASTISALCVPMSVSAVKGNPDNSLYITTESIPDDVVTYARDAFSDYSYNDMVNLDFDGETIQNVRLSKPFKVETFEMENDGYVQYYFPVVNNDSVEAVLTINVNTSDNSMSYQLGKDMLTLALDNADSSESNPITICANEECYFSVDSDGYTELLYDFDNITGNENLPENIDSEWFTDSQTVCINSKNVYSDELGGWDSARKIMGIKLPVVYVQNTSYNDTGMCAAACFGSLSTYYTNPETGGSATDGQNMRNIAISAYPNGLTISDVRSLLIKYNNVTMTTKSGILSWDNIKTEISTRSPFFTKWVRSGGVHGLVVSGYTYDDTTDGSRVIYVMDPNVGTNVSISYSASGCTYSPSASRTYTWEQTLYRA